MASATNLIVTNPENLARQPEPFRIKCAEIWGGIMAINTDVCTAGLSASIFSTAHDGDRGGDMYYVSVCKWDYLTRMAIADLRGHGGQASRLSAWVYDSMERRMNTTSGNKVLSDLNGEVKSRGFVAITTAVVVSYHAMKQRLYFSYAGHPPAYVQRHGGDWQTLTLDSGSPQTNLPLGVLPNVKYDIEQIRMKRGDRICLYTDGVPECTGPDDEPFGETRLADSLNRNAALSPAELKLAILADLERHRGGRPPDDDMTLLIAELY
ncbi:MAG TPA: PP2C family protein-serine/threonine phosphatase [Bryobacteraceae bacterium]|nr:PP2C family protein-serine/threonine phosphatase [Bryobacteraceae bacterium]